MDAAREVSRRAFLVTATLEGALGVLAVVLAHATDVRLLGDTSHAGRDALVGVALALPLLAGLLALRRSRLGPFVRLRTIVDERIRPLFAACTWDEIVALACAAGIGEELLFRGFLQPWLARSFGAAVAIVVTSAVFGALHALTRTYAILAALVAALLGVAQLATGGVVAPAVAHAVYDAAAFAVILRGARPAEPA